MTSHAVSSSHDQESDEFDPGPRRTRPFLDRHAELTAIRDAIDDRRSQGETGLVVLTGVPGIGKRAVAGKPYHDAPHRFGGRYIPIDARDASQSEILGQGLCGFGLTEAELPASEADRAIAFRRRSRGQKYLMVVEDATSAEQVVNLIPHGAPGATVFVTSDVPLQDLEAEHDFVVVAVRKLPPAASRELLRHDLGTRAAGIPDRTLDALADCCDGLPLVIKLLAAKLRRHPTSAGDTLERLRVSGLDLLGIGTTQRVRGFLDMTYAELDEDLKHAYRTLGLLPGLSFGPEAASAALDMDRARAVHLLDVLADANLLLHDETTGRYEWHRVIRDDARWRAGETDRPGLVRAKVEQITTWYLQEAIHHDAALSGRWHVGEEFERHATSGRQPASREEAIAWFDAEWEAVVAAVRLAHEHAGHVVGAVAGDPQGRALHAVAWQLCVAVFKYLHLHGHYDAWVGSHQLGLASAHAYGDLPGIMQVTSQRGAARLALGELDAAEEDFLASLDAAIRAGHWMGEQSAREWLGKVAMERGRHDRALRWYAESEDTIRRADDRIVDAQPARMLALLALHRSRVRRARREWTDARAAAVVALEYFDAVGESDNRAKCLDVLGDAALGGGNAAEAVEIFERVVAFHAADGARRAHADAARKLGEARAAAGDDDGARAALVTARDLYRALGDPKEDDVAARLSDVGGR